MHVLANTDKCIIGCQITSSGEDLTVQHGMRSLYRNFANNKLKNQSLDLRNTTSELNMISIVEAWSWKPTIPKLRYGWWVTWKPTISKLWYDHVHLQLLHLWQCFPFAILVETILWRWSLQEEIQRQICHVDQNNPLMARNKSFSITIPIFWMHILNNLLWVKCVYGFNKIILGM
jgi:hypothetical protein